MLCFHVVSILNICNVISIHLCNTYTHLHTKREAIIFSFCRLGLTWKLNEIFKKKKTTEDKTKRKPFHVGRVYFKCSVLIVPFNAVPSYSQFPKKCCEPQHFFKSTTCILCTWMRFVFVVEVHVERGAFTWIA